MNRLKTSCAAWLVLSTLCWILAGGCQSPEVVAPSGPRAATSPEQVKIYQKQPKKYEELGVIEVPIGGDVRWDERAHAKGGFDQLKQRAAALGANGLLLQVPDGKQDFMVVAGDGNDYYQVPMRNEPRRAVAQAIYVLKEK